MKRYDLLKKSIVTTGNIKVGSIDIANNMDLELKSGLQYMLAPQIDPRTGQITGINLEAPNKRPIDFKPEFENVMDKMAKEIEEDAWIVLQYRIGSITLEEAQAQRDELYAKRRMKIREEELANAKARLIEFMEGL